MLLSCLLCTLKLFTASIYHRYVHHNTGVYPVLDFLLPFSPRDNPPLSLYPPLLSLTKREHKKKGMGWNFSLGCSERLDLVKPLS